MASRLCDYCLPDGRTGGDDSTREERRVYAVSATGLHDESGFRPDLERNRCTSRGQILESQRNLSPLVDQRFSVVIHAESQELTMERTRHVTAWEVAVGHHRHASNSGIDEAGEVEPGGDAVPIGEVHDLTT